MTLEDVAMIWQFPVEGTPVTMDYMRKSKDEWTMYIFQMVGWVPSSQQMKGFQLGVSHLYQHLADNPITDESSPEEVQKWSRGYLLLMLSSLMSTTSSHLVSASYIHYL